MPGDSKETVDGIDHRNKEIDARQIPWTKHHS
jgi:hypothetical protein